MNTINERRAPENIQLSGVQKYVLCKLIAAETPSTAYEEVRRSGANVATATDYFTKIGLMTVDENTAEANITEKGMEVLHNEALIDDTNELTDDGQLWGYANSPEEAAKADFANKGKPEAPVQSNELPSQMSGNLPTDTSAVATQDTGGPDAFSIESLRMLQGFREIIKEANFWKKIKS